MRMHLQKETVSVLENESELDSIDDIMIQGLTNDGSIGDFPITDADPQTAAHPQVKASKYQGISKDNIRLTRRECLFCI
jgi:hypothetical protein